MSALVLPPVVKSIGLSVLGKRKPQSLLEAAQHNRRHPEGRGWNHKSDLKKIRLNQCLIGPDSAEGVVALQMAMMASVDYTPKRKDYSQAFELVYTTPKDFSFDYSEYFAWCLTWTMDNLGRDIVLTADSHFDEGAPHLHILMAPIVGGEWVGNGFTSTKTWPTLQAKFGRDLELKFGLKLVPQLKGKALTEAAHEVKERLTAVLAPHVSPAVLEALLKLAWRKPSGLVGPLGIADRSGGNGEGDGGAAFKRIAMSAGKGPKREREPNAFGIGLAALDGPSNAYGIDSIAYGIESGYAIDPEKINPILVNGVGSETPPTAPIFDSVTDRQELAIDDSLGSSGHPAPVHYQPLTDIPDEYGEIAPPSKSKAHDLLVKTLFANGLGQRAAGDALATATLGVTPALFSGAVAGTSSTPSVVGDALDVPATECEFVAATDGDDGEDF